MKALNCPRGHDKMKLRKINKTVNFRGMEIPCQVETMSARNVEWRQERLIPQEPSNSNWPKPSGNGWDFLPGRRLSRYGKKED